MTRLDRLRWLALVAVSVVVVDQLTKQWALNALADGHTIDIVWTLRFNLAFNTGMAFSQGDGLGPLIGVLALAVVVVLVIAVGKERVHWNPLAVGLVTGGAVGNVIDRLLRGDAWMRGAVVDFIDLQWFPIFNVADIGVTVGGGLLVLTYILGQHDAAETATGPGARADDTSTGDGDGASRRAAGSSSHED